MEPIKYTKGSPKGTLNNDPKHPMCVEVEVLENRYFNGPDGTHAGPGTRMWRAEAEIEPNRSIFLPVTSPEYRAYRSRMDKAEKAESASK